MDNIGAPCVVVAHSYGGAPTTQALPGAEMVKRVVYVSGWQLDVGESALSVMGERPPGWLRENKEAGYYEMSPWDVFYRDLPEEEAAAAAAALGPQSRSSLEQSLTQAVWRTGTFTTHIYGEDEGSAQMYKG